MASKCLAPGEVLALKCSNEVEDGGDHKNDGCRDQTCCMENDAEPLDSAHNAIDSCAHIIRGESSDKLIKGGRGRADSKQERDFNEDEN